MPPDASAVRPQKIILQIGMPLTFETVANHAEGWRRIAAFTKVKIAALSACELPSRKFHTRHWGGKLLLTARFSRLLLRRRLRSLAGFGGAFR
jgi:hypothetical protein